MSSTYNYDFNSNVEGLILGYKWPLKPEDLVIFKQEKINEILVILKILRNEQSGIHQKLDIERVIDILNKKF